MSIIGNATVSAQLTGDVNAQISYAAAQNASSPGLIETVTLAMGVNTFTPPTGAKRVIIHKPTGNLLAIQIGSLQLDYVDPDSISVAGGSLALNSPGGSIAGVILVWI